jgi:VWFA-related protein
MSRAKAVFGIVILAFGCLLVGQEEVFRSQSNVVIVPALVKDAAGRIVYGLEAKDFLVNDNGVEQIVHLDDAAENEPLSIVVAIETGRRAKREFPRMRGLSSMLSPMMSERDSQVALLEFDSKVHLIEDFTHFEDRIDSALQDLQPGDNGAAILDAVKYSAQLLRKVPQGRQRVLLLISETRDHGSHLAKIDGVVSLVGDSSIVIYALTFSPSLSQFLDTERGSNHDEVYWNSPGDLLPVVLMARQAIRKNTTKAVAEMTGGEYQLFSSREAFETLMTGITNHLHERYLLSFEPNKPSPGLHRILVRLRKAGNYTVLSRTTYWAHGNSDEDRGAEH